MKIVDGNVQNALIVGASSIIGSEISALFQKASLEVITTYTSDAVGSVGDASRALRLDLREDESIEAFMQNLSKVWTNIDIAIFLSSILPGKSLSGYEFSDIDEVMSVNFNGQAKLISKLLPFFNEQSRLLMFSSISAQRGSFDPIYAASKGAMLSLVKSLATALPSGARINAIAPGLVHGSGMYRAMSGEGQERHRNQVHSKKLLDPKDLSKIVFDLCQPHWAHLNGACIDLNGGQNVR